MWNDVSDSDSTVSPLPCQGVTGIGWTSAVSNTLVGQTLGHYKILDQLGAGGMGIVYRAQDTKLGRQVALKVLPTGNTSGDEAVERFRREARTASALNHPNICTIYGFDEHGGQLYLAMELLDGEPLDRRLSGRPLELRNMLDIATQVADALDAAHAEGILHRDVKPGNIFLTRRGPVKVLDFGLAKLSPEYRRRSGRIEARNNETQQIVPEHFTSAVGTTVGTIAYMSPEQARGDDVDPRTDLFSFGVVLYEMCTGRQSFPGHTTAVVFDGILNRDPVPPSTLNAMLPPELDRIISKALEKDRGLRYQTAADIGADLKRLRRDSASKAGIVTAGSGAKSPMDAATVVINSTETQVGARSGISSAPTVASVSPSTAGSDASAVIRAAAKTPWFWGAGAAVVAIAAIAAGIGAYFASRDGGRAPVQQAAAPPVTSPATPPPAETTPPAGSQPPPVTVAPPAATQPVAPTTKAGGQVAPGSSTQKPAPVAGTSAAGTKLPAKSPVGAVPTPVSRDSDAAQRLEVAKAKIANNLNEQALNDLRQIIIDFPQSAAAAEAAFLSADIHEKTGNANEAMAAFVEFESRFARDRRAPESKLRRAQILSRRGQPTDLMQARELYADVARDHPSTGHAQIALQQKLRLETSQKNLRAIDPVMKIQVPAVILTLREIIAQFPDSAQAMAARMRLATMLEDMDRHKEAAEMFEELGARAGAGSNPGDVFFRLGELYERRLKDPARAKDAYAKVPPNSSRYNEAQRRLKRR
jgi:serine/threonine protein kinase/TolA-binding protein